MAEFMFRLEKKINTIVNSRGVDPGGPPPNILLKGPCISRTPPIIKLQNVHPCQSVIKIMKCLYCLNCPKFGQLIIRKIIRIVANRCQIFGGKNLQISISAGAPPQTHLGSLQRSSAGGAYSAPPDPWLHLWGSTFEGSGRGGKMNKGEKGGLKKGVWAPNLHHRSTPLPACI